LAARQKNDNEGLGLMANGSSGGWEVAVDETSKGPARRFVQLEGPSVYFSFEVPSPDMISQFAEGGNRNASNRQEALAAR
jgi:hypothetical protein